MPIAQSAEQRAIADAIAQWAQRSGAIAAVRAREPGVSGAESADPRDVLKSDHWTGLTEFGIFSVAVPAELGGAGGSVADLASAVEPLAAALVPGPVLPTLIGCLVLARSGAAWARGLLAELAAGSASVAVAWPAHAVASLARPVATGGSEGTLIVTGTAGPVLGAGEATHLLLSAQHGERTVWFVTEAGQPGVGVTARAPVDFSRALGEVMLDQVQVPAAAVLDGIKDDLVAELTATLAAAEASGIAAWCGQCAAEYAKTRRQFGRPIGSFQAVKHLCAQLLCRAELASAAAWDAANAVGQAPDEHPLAAACAAAIALDAAVDNAKDCIQVLGGIGFTWEHDAHLYLRRALALRSLLGGAASWRARAAELALSGMRRRPQDEELTPASAFRTRARLAAIAISAMPPVDRRAGLVELGYAAPAWPPPYGISATPAEQLIIDEELAATSLARPDIGIGGWAIPAISAHGTPDQLARFAGPTLRGEITWCQLFSEPEAGSDLAALRTRAVRAEGGWRLTGQKVWTSLARQADWAICLARTDADVPKHKGISYFLVWMRDAGIEIRPLREMTGREMFNEVFLDDVFVPAECVVGEPGDGWRIARTTLATERVAMVRGARLSEDVEALLSVASAADAAGLDQVGARVAEGLALAVLDDRLAAAIAAGEDAGKTAAVRKLLGVAHRQAVAETALSLHGAQGAAADGAAAAAVHEFLLTRCLSIAGGTTQILLSLVAERVLGLPRDETR